MKYQYTIMRGIILMVLLFAVSSNTKSQSVAQKKEGEVTYNLVIASDNLSAMIGSMSQTMDIKFKNDKWVMSTETAVPGMGGMVTRIVYDPKKKKTRSFFNMNKLKYELVMTPEEKNEATENNPMASILSSDSSKFSFKSTDSAINVLGHLCRKYTGGNNATSMEIYVCDSLYIPTGAINSTQLAHGGTNIFEGINGGILKCVMTMNIMSMEMKSTITATKISYAPVKNSEFKMHGGYKKITMKDLKKLMMINI